MRPRSWRTRANPPADPYREQVGVPCAVNGDPLPEGLLDGRLCPAHVREAPRSGRRGSLRMTRANRMCRPRKHVHGVSSISRNAEGIVVRMMRSETHPRPDVHRHPRPFADHGRPSRPRTSSRNVGRHNPRVHHWRGRRGRASSRRPGAHGARADARGSATGDHRARAARPRLRGVRGCRPPPPPAHQPADHPDEGFMFSLGHGVGARNPRKPRRSAKRGMTNWSPATSWPSSRTPAIPASARCASRTSCW